MVETILLLAATSTWAFAQTNGLASIRYSDGAIPYGAILGVHDPVVVGQPYSAEINARKAELRPDGTSVIYESHGSVARDSEGRVRREQFESPKLVSPDGRTVFLQFGVVISDPVKQAQFRWGARATAAEQSPLFPTFTGSSDAEPCEHHAKGTRSYANGETQSIELLETMAIQGISVRGCRVTTLIPARVVRGGKAYTVTDDSWSSIEMHLTILRVQHDAGTNTDETVELDKIVRAEPDPALFQPPQGYPVEEAYPTELISHH
jgi:hypothetical protein